MRFNISHNELGRCGTAGRNDDYGTTQWNQHLSSASYEDDNVSSSTTIVKEVWITSESSKPHQSTHVMKHYYYRNQRQFGDGLEGHDTIRTTFSNDTTLFRFILQRWVLDGLY